MIKENVEYGKKEIKSKEAMVKEVKLVNSKLDESLNKKINVKKKSKFKKEETLKESK